MHRSVLSAALALALVQTALTAQQPSTDGPYKVLTRAKVGGEGGWDYIFADPVGRRLYIPRGAVRAVAATDSTPARDAVAARITVFNLDDLSPVGQILTAPNSNGNGVAVDPKSGHGFSSSRPQITMFDTKSMQLLKSIPIDSGVGPDGILFDGFNDRVYVFSHPTKDATVIDSKSGTVLGRIDLGGVPEQGVADGNGTLYVVMQDVPGSVTVVDTKTMKATAHYPLGEAGRCNGLALDAKNHVLFAACGMSGPAPVAGQPPAPAAPVMVILNATNGNVLARLPLAGGSDGATFNPQTMEAFSTGGNGTLTVIKEKSATSFEVEEILPTMNGARTIAFDSKTGHIFTMSQERGPAPPPPAGGGRGGQAPAIPGSFTILMINK
jgi:DNA-binding beta-propeller fold protein YncE